MSSGCFLSPSNIFLIAIVVRFPPHRSDVDPNWSFTKHISRSLPTEMIFYLLRSIPTGFLTRLEGVKTLEIITKWFQVSVIECN